MATTTITIPDYDQFAEDHQCLLIVVKQLGKLLACRNE